MIWSKRTPLAWKNLTVSPRKLGLAAGGVGFAVLLMFMQIGFRNALFDSTVQIAEILNGDLIIVSKLRNNLPNEQRFDRRIIDFASGLKGVRNAIPIYLERARTEIRVVGLPSRMIRVIGVPLQDGVFRDARINAQLHQLQDKRVALLDRKTKNSFGFERSSRDALRDQDIELSGKRIQLVDWVEIGTDFVHDGSLIVSDEAMRHYFPYRVLGLDPLSVVDFGLVQLEDTADADETAQLIEHLSGGAVDVFSKQKLVNREIKFWQEQTPIGIIFTVGTIMGLVVGTIICYQILYTDISDHLAEFATLKAMGYPSKYFGLLVLQQALYLTVIGFIPGFLIAASLYWLLSTTTGLIMMLTPLRILLIFGLTLLMCVLSGILAVRRLWSADPATLF